MRSNVPLIACSLDATDQRKRVGDWAELLAQARARQETPDGVRYVFAAGDDLERRLEALAVAEQSCCAFLNFEISESRDELELMVKAPPDGQEALRFIFSA
jgi:hypothetical protein